MEANPENRRILESSRERDLALLEAEQRLGIDAVTLLENFRKRAERRIKAYEEIIRIYESALGYNK
ncbi:MAG TPA: hypothetical protein P5277_04900 [Candidatus Paceibacterota bacterium]|nr:hypothetical protein [Candidatus Paceibacterota bacterium]